MGSAWDGTGISYLVPSTFAASAGVTMAKTKVVMLMTLFADVLCAGKRSGETEDMSAVGGERLHRLEPDPGVAPGDQEVLSSEVDTREDLVCRRAWAVTKRCSVRVNQAVAAGETPLTTASNPTTMTPRAAKT